MSSKGLLAPTLKKSQASPRVATRVRPPWEFLVAILNALLTLLYNRRLHCEHESTTEKEETETGNGKQNL